MVGKILPDNEMPSIATLNDGEVIRNDSKVSFKADIVANPLGIINQLNIADLKLF